MDDQGENKGDLTVYETSFLILPSIPEDKLSETVESIRKIVAKAGGTEIDSESPFKHPLSYSMSKTVGSKKYVVNEAYIGWIKFEIESSKIAEIEAALKKFSEVLRFLIVKAPRKTEFTFAKAKVALKAKEEKEREPASVEDSGVAMEEVKEAIIE